MPSEIDPTLNEKISDISKALEDMALGLIHNKMPLDTSKVNAAIEKFDSRQDQANALCSAVQQVNPKRMVGDINVPPLQIDGEKGGTDWAALRVYANAISNDNAYIAETLYVLPINQEELKNLKCNLTTQPAQQAEATKPNPDHK